MPSRKRIFTWLKRFFYACILFILILFIGLYFYLPSQHFNDQLKSIITEQLANQVNGEVSIGSIEGNLLNQITIHDINIHSEQGEFLNIETIKLDWSPYALTNRQLNIQLLEISDLRLTLRKGENDEIDLPFHSDTQSKEPLESDDKSLPISLNISAFNIKNFHLIHENNEGQQHFPALHLQSSLTGQKSLNLNINLQQGNSSANIITDYHLNKRTLDIESFLIQQFELQPYFPKQKLEGKVDAHIEGHLNLKDLHQSSAILNLKTNQLNHPLYQHIHLNLQVTIQDSELDAKVKTELAGGNIQLEATSHLLTQTSALQLDFQSLNLETFSQNEQLTSNLNGKIQFKSDSYNPLIASCELKAELSQSQLHDNTIHSIRLNAKMAEQSIELHQFEAKTKQTKVQAKGIIDLWNMSVHSAEVQAQCKQLEEWSPLLPIDISGDIHLSIKGGYSAPGGELEAIFSSNNLKALNHLFQDTQIKLNGHFSDEGSSTSTCAISIDQYSINSKATEQQFSIKQIQLKSYLQQKEFQFKGHLDKLGFSHRTSRYELPQKSNFDVRYPDLKVSDFILTNKHEMLSLSLNGNLHQNFQASLSLDHFDPYPWALDWIQLDRYFDTLDLTTTLSGNLYTPKLSTRLKINNPQHQSLRLEHAILKANYDGHQAKAMIQVSTHSGDALSISATSPGLLQLAPQFKFQGFKTIEAKIKSTPLDLKPWSSLTKPHLSELEGHLELDCSVKGPFEHIQAIGDVAFKNIHLKSPWLKEPLTGLNFNLNMNEKAWRILPFKFNIGEGQISLSANTLLEERLPTSLNLELGADLLPFHYENMLEGKLSSNIQILSDFKSLDLQGKIDIHECLLRPDLEFLNRNISPRDASIILVDELTKEKGAQNKKQDNPFPIKLNLSTHFPKNIKVLHDKLKAEFGGKLNLEKTYKEKDFKVLGNIQSKRGYLIFLGSRFTIDEATIKLQGTTQIPPSVFIRSQARIDDYHIEILFKGPVDKPELIMKSSPSLSQADILSVLTFGKPMNKLGEGEKKSFSQQASEFAAGFAATQLQTFLRDQFGLDQVGIELENIDKEDGRIGLTRYINDKTHISVSQELRKKQGRIYRLEREIKKNIKVHTERDSEGNNGIDVIYEKRY